MAKTTYASWLLGVMGCILKIHLLLLFVHLLSFALGRGAGKPLPAGGQGVLDGRESWKHSEARHLEVAGKLLFRKDLSPAVLNA